MICHTPSEREEDNSKTARIMADLIRAVEEKANGQEPVPETRFHSHDAYVSYGLKASDFYCIINAFRSRILDLNLADRLRLAHQLLETHIGELGHAGIRVIAFSVDELTPVHFSAVDGLLDHFRSWSQVDHMAEDVIKPLLKRYRAETLALLEEWNRSPVRWRRRASVVAFTRKIGESGEFVDDVLRLCGNLIWDEEDIVQKGVGWTLKDNLRAAPDRILPYIKDLRRRGIPSTITLYAIRDLKGEERKAVLSIKKSDTSDS